MVAPAERLTCTHVSSCESHALGLRCTSILNNLVLTAHGVLCMVGHLDFKQFLCKGIPLDAQCRGALVTIYVIAVCNGAGQHGDIL